MLRDSRGTQITFDEYTENDPRENQERMYDMEHGASTPSRFGLNFSVGFLSPSVDAGHF